MDSPLILCNIQKCALEQVQAAVEQFGRSETKHFLYIALFWFSGFRWDTFSVFEGIQFKNIQEEDLRERTGKYNHVQELSKSDVYYKWMDVYYYFTTSMANQILQH